MDILSAIPVDTELSSNNVLGRIPSVRSHLEVQTATKSSKPRMWSLFGRKSATFEDTKLPSAPRTQHQVEPTLDSAGQPSMMVTNSSPLRQASQSDQNSSRTTRTRSKSQPRPQRRTSTPSFADASPLQQTLPQARFHTFVQIPSKTHLHRLMSDSSRRSGSSTDSAYKDLSAIHPALRQEARLTRRYDDRSSSSFDFEDKLIVLTNHGDLLQYAAAGTPHRLPEKTITLLEKSTAFASDAITGKYWVLEITAGEIVSAEDGTRLSRSPWSMFSTRNSQSQQSLTNTLLIFDSPEIMQSCLTAIREAIKQSGQPRATSQVSPDNAALAIPSLSYSSTEEFHISTEFLRSSHSSSNLRKELPNPPRAEKDLPSLPAVAACRASASGLSVAASSAGTANSLERLRDVDSGSTTTATTNSLDGSTSLESPVRAVFANLPPLATIKSRTSMTIERQALKECFPNKPTSDQHKSGIQQTSEPHTHDTEGMTVRNQKSEFSEAFATQPRVIDRPLSQTGQHAASIVALSDQNTKATRSPTRKSFSAEMPILNHKPDLLRPATSHVQHTSKLSTDTLSKSTYSLFPRKLVHEIKAEPLVMPEADHIPALPYNHATDASKLSSAPPAANHMTTFSTPPKSNGRKPAALKLLAHLDVEQPMRSPAVSDDMLASNFGTSSLKPSPSPISPSQIKVPSFDDLKIDFDFFKSTLGSDSKDDHKPTEGPNLVRRHRSTPSLPASKTPTAPVGPPPRGPLPAVPPPSAHEIAVSKRSSSQTKGESVKSPRRTSARSSTRTSPAKVSPKAQVLKELHPNISSPTKQQSNGKHVELNANEDLVVSSSDAAFGTPSIMSSPVQTKPRPSQQNHWHSWSNNGTKSANLLQSHKKTKSTDSSFADFDCGGIASFNLTCNAFGAKPLAPRYISYGYEKDDKICGNIFADF